jgi:aminopeptidase N
MRVFARMSRPFALPGTRAKWAPDRPFEIRHIKLVIGLDLHDHRVDGSATLTVVPRMAGASALTLDAVEMEALEVRGPGGKKLAFAYDGAKLRVDLAALELRLGRPFDLTISYSCHPRRGLYFIQPDEAYPERPSQVWTQGQDEDSRYYFPCIDDPEMKATSEVIVTVPETWFALSNGRLVKKQRVARGEHAFHWRMDTPHACYLITIAAGELVELRDHWKDVEVLYYVPPGREADARRALGKTPKMIDLFSRRFGLPYPYPKYAQVVVAEFIFGGMENTTATTLTDAVLYDARAALDHDMEDLVSHELAHQWFGDLLTCRAWGHGWLNEGFAMYAEYIWREHSEGRDQADMLRADWRDGYFNEDGHRYRRPVATNVYDEPIDIFDAHLYEKGGLVLHMLRTLLGDEAYFAALGHYVRKHREGSVETRDLARAVSESSGRSLDWFFDQWIHKTGYPELGVELSHDPGKKLLKVTVKQTQKTKGNDTPLFRLPTTVRVRVRGQDRDLPLEIVEAQEVFVFAVEAPPTQIIFDPGRNLLAEVKTDKSRSLWLAELAGATHAADRMAAAQALGKHATREVVSALDKALRGDGFWGVSAAAAIALGSQRSEAARAALVRALPGLAHPKVRRAICRALGQFRHDEQAASALAGLLERGDKSYFVEAEAALALGKTRVPRALAILEDQLGKDSHLDVIRAHAYRGLAELKDDQVAPVLLAGTRYGKVSQGRRAATMALAHLTQGRSDHLAVRARERLEELLEDRDFRVQTTAIEALATLGDPRAGAALRRVSERELDGRLKRRSREVVRDLREGRAASEQVTELGQEVEKLRGELIALRERLAKMEAPAAKASGKGKKAR